MKVQNLTKTVLCMAY